MRWSFLTYQTCRCALVARTRVAGLARWVRAWCVRSTADPKCVHCEARTACRWAGTVRSLRRRLAYLPQKSYEVTPVFSGESERCEAPCHRVAWPFADAQGAGSSTISARTRCEPAAAASAYAFFAYLPGCSLLPSLHSLQCAAYARQSIPRIAAARWGWWLVTDTDPPSKIKANFGTKFDILPTRISQEAGKAFC